MTLSKQLMLTGFLILLCLFAGMITFVVINTQAFLNNQLASHSQDTATALGLTLTTTMKNNDVSTAQRVVDAVWDRGYYKSIIIEGSDGKPLVERREQIKVYSVPDWFINHFPLHTEGKEALIMDGWQKVGKVKIESNPGFAYRQIWSTFVDSSLWFLVTGIIALILGSMLLYVILKPLRNITKQALAICNQQFSIQKNLPWTFDLRLVVEAMNNMTMRIKRMFEEQAEVSEELRKQAFKDPVSGLGNRRFFDMQLDYLLQDSQRGIGGALLLIEIMNFKEYNDKYGYAKGDELLKNTAQAIAENVTVDGAIVTHLKGASFAVILPNKGKDVAENTATDICKAFSLLKQKGLSEEEYIANIGFVMYYEGETKKDILSKADMALRQAQTQGKNSCQFLETRTTQVHGSREWVDIFAAVVRENKIILHFQEINLFDKPTKSYEVLMRIQHENEIIPAGVFLPMAERTNSMVALDKLLIENVIQKIQRQTATNFYYVNLSNAFAEDKNLQSWLFEKVRSLGKKANQFIIELPEYAVVNRIEAIREFFIQFAKIGGQTSIDHYGKSFSSFSYLYNLKLNFLKIDGGYIHQIESHEENQFFVRKLVDIGHSLGICIIAESVETQSEYQTLMQLKVDGVQGYFVGKPKELGE